MHISMSGAMPHQESLAQRGLEAPLTNQSAAESDMLRCQRRGTPETDAAVLSSLPPRAGALTTSRSLKKGRRSACDIDPASF